MTERRPEILPQLRGRECPPRPGLQVGGCLNLACPPPVQLSPNYSGLRGSVMGIGRELALTIGTSPVSQSPL